MMVRTQVPLEFFPHLCGLPQAHLVGHDRPPNILPVQLHQPVDTHELGGWDGKRGEMGQRIVNHHAIRASRARMLYGLLFGFHYCLACNLYDMVVLGLIRLQCQSCLDPGWVRRDDPGSQWVDEWVDIRAVEWVGPWVSVLLPMCVCVCG